MKSEKVALVSFGLGGHSEDYHREGGSAHLSGYDKPDDWKPDEGVDYSTAVVIDKRDILEINPGLAFRSPLVNPATQGVDKFHTNLLGSIIAGEMAARSGLVAACIAIHATTPEDAPGPFDRVGVPEYTAWWKSHGAKVGIVNAQGRIAWEDGTIQPRKLSQQEMAASIGAELDMKDSWAFDCRILREGQVIRDKVGKYSICSALAELGAPTHA